MKQPTAPLMENATGSYPSAVNQGQLQQFKVWPCPMTGQQMVHHQQHQQQLQQKVCFAPVQPQSNFILSIISQSSFILSHIFSYRRG